MPPTQTTAPSMCSAKASAAMSGRPVRGTIKRYYSGYTLAYASYGKEGLISVRASSSQRLPPEVERPVDRRPGRPSEVAVAAVKRRRAVAVVDGGLHLCGASRRALGEDALAVLAVVVAVVLEHLVAKRPVVPARVAERLRLGARVASPRLRPLGRGGCTAVGARELVRHHRPLPQFSARPIDGPADPVKLPSRPY